MARESASASLERVHDMAQAADEWAALEPWCDTTVFQSPAWVRVWLRTVLPRFEVLIVRAMCAGVVVGLGFIVRRRIRRRLFSVDTLYVNEAGPSDMDFCVEHNGFLLHREYGDEALTAIVRCLCASLRWDELQLRRAATAGAVRRLRQSELDTLGLRLRQGDPDVAPYVDLDEVRARGGDYLGGLTANRRAQIRRGLRLLAKLGPIDVTVARTRAEALHYLDGLKHHHQRYWEARGESGVFANPAWEEFHRTLIEALIPVGGVQVLRVKAGNTTVGYIYSLVREGCVYMVQSGINYTLDPKTHPGECCHVLAIEWNLRAGNHLYDFLAGDMRYKRSLANRIAPMDTWVLQRKRWRFVLEDRLRELRDRVNRWRVPAPQLSRQEE